MEWHEFKNWLAEATMLDRDALHVYAAVLIQLISAWIFRRSLASLWPWCIVLVIAVINEYFDYEYIRCNPTTRELFFEGALHDMWNTMLMPTVLMVVARFWPQRLVREQLQQTDDPAEPE